MKSTISAEDTSKSYPYATFDEVWDSAIIVLMQQDIIVHSSKDSGVIATVMRPPVVVLLEEGKDTIVVYLYWMDYVYKSLDEPQKMTVAFEEYELKKKSYDLFDKLSTQIYAGKKWKYLYKGTPEIR